MALEIKIPAVGESITEVTLTSWLKKDGEYVEMDEVICELESDKATLELTAEAAGILKTLANEGDTIEIGSVVASIDTDAKAPEGAAPAKETKKEEKKAEQPKADSKPAAKEPEAAKTYASGAASPAAQKILAEKGVSASDVKGTGRDGRITKADAVAAKLSVTTNTEKSREQRSEKMSNLRKAVARRLVSVKNETAMLTTFNEVNMKPIMDLRTQYKNQFKETHGVGLGFMSFFIKAVCNALQEFPSVNAMIDGDSTVFNDYCDVSIAVSAPKGLVVPVIRNAEAMNFAEIEAEVIRLATRARDNKLSIEEMTGGTFTITNGGVFGSLMSTPIINPPQSAILGMHNIVERPVVIDGQIVARPMMYIALSYDHRIIDGRESVSFLVRVKQQLENPLQLLTGGKDPGAFMLGL